MIVTEYKLNNNIYEPVLPSLSFNDSQQLYQYVINRFTTPNIYSNHSEGDNYHLIRCVDDETRIFHVLHD
jgi:hypothetical protein